MTQKSPRPDGAAVEETRELRLDFTKLTRLGDDEVLPVAVQDARTDEVILVAYVSREALEESLRLRKAVFWSTSRHALWYKGREESGNSFTLEEIRVNCEQNSLVYRVTPDRGGICHTRYPDGAYRNCFYRRLNLETGVLEEIKET
ncbi:MAG: phosphoribosyl-AMP cyclohydrolase [Oscillospiraceae bacterium]|jgi:phosphoribosyl-AMP cyclohydrolase|nr:phosphoribosyl-AMP cyclohydrolase [Oscillospiraceae bacterium]